MADLGKEAVFSATGVETLDAVLPGPPRFWSYSSLKEFELCPRRYALSRAQYPDYWNGRGFPRSATIGAIKGSIVHGAVETVVKALIQERCPSMQSEQAVTILRKLGGFRTIAEERLEVELTSLEDNPRVSVEGRNQLARTLRNWMPEAREQVQTFLSRVVLTSTSSTRAVTASSASATSPRSPIGLGDHSEKALTTDSPRLTGRVDLMTVKDSGVVITDFKTGKEDPSHRDQLQLYAFLWLADSVANPNGLPVSGLIVSYPTHTVDVDVPTQSEMATLRERYLQLVSDFDDALTSQALVAKTGSHCATCDVRVLCDAYWESEHLPSALVPVDTWHDVDGVVSGNPGVKTWLLKESRTGHALIVRTPLPTYTLPLDRHVRILGVRRIGDPEDGEALVTLMASSSEIFVLTS